MAGLGDQDDSLHGLGTEGHARRMQMEKWRADQGGKRPHSYSVGPAMTWRPGGPRRRSKSRPLRKQPSIVGLFTKKSAMTNLPGRYCPVPMAFAAGRSVRCLRSRISRRRRAFSRTPAAPPAARQAIRRRSKHGVNFAGAQRGASSDFFLYYKQYWTGTLWKNKYLF